MLDTAYIREMLILKIAYIKHTDYIKHTSYIRQTADILKN